MDPLGHFLYVEDVFRAVVIFEKAREIIQRIKLVSEIEIGEGIFLFAVRKQVVEGAKLVDAAKAVFKQRRNIVGQARFRYF